MPVLWFEQIGAEVGIIGEAAARAQQAEQDVFTLAAAWGAAIVGGIAYFFGPGQPWSPPGMPFCTAETWGIPPYGGDDDWQMDMAYVSFYDQGSGGPGPDPI